MTRLPVTLLGVPALAACSIVFLGMSSASGQTPAAQVTIEAPADGVSTAARSILVTGSAPSAPRRGEALVTVTVNRRPAVVTVRRGRYSTQVALEVGRNQITAKAELYGPGDDEPTTTTTASAVVTRNPVPGDGTRTLDLAPAYLVATYSDDFYWLCGEGDDCAASSRCVQVGPRRVDCPSGAESQGDRHTRCYLVITVRLREGRLYQGGYGCRGRLVPNPERFVRRELFRKGRWFRLDEREAPWFSSEVNDVTPYGVPRFDIVNDVLLP